MTEGVYRRIYSGFLDNAKVNSVSWMAEAWFWRLVVLADDFGNLKGNWRHLAVNASPVREIDAAQAKALTLELVKAKLVELYQVDDKQYIHIKGFTERQPANKNGRRIQKEPMNPEESESDLVNPGESGGIQTNPEESSASDSDSDSDTHTQGGACVVEQPQPKKRRRKAESDNDRLIPEYTEKFQQFWSAYPGTRKMNKFDTFEIWKTQKIERDDKPLFDIVMRGLDAWKKCHMWTKDGGQFVCTPTVFLNQRRWANEPPTAPKEVPQ
jgi:hypothetical protein